MLVLFSNGELQLIGEGESQLVVWLRKVQLRSSTMCQKSSASPNRFTRAVENHLLMVRPNLNSVSLESDRTNLCWMLVRRGGARSQGSWPILASSCPWPWSIKPNTFTPAQTHCPFVIILASFSTKNAFENLNTVVRRLLQRPPATVHVVLLLNGLFIWCLDLRALMDAQSCNTPAWRLVSAVRTYLLFLTGRGLVYEYRSSFPANFKVCSDLRYSCPYGNKVKGLSRTPIIVGFNMRSSI